MNDQLRESPAPAMCHEWIFYTTPGSEHQCSRKSKRMVGDHWYCEQHAKFHEKWDTPEARTS